MRNKFIFIILFYCLSWQFAIAQSWQITESPTHQNLARLDMLSTQLGWAVSYDGLILKYNGYAWTISDSLRRIKANFLPKSDSVAVTTQDDLGDIYTISMVDASHGWIAVNNVKNRNYVLIKYENNQWQLQPYSFPVKFRAVDFLNPNFGIAVGDGGAFRYKAGRWSVLKLPLSSDFRTVQIVSDKSIFIAGQRGVVLRYADGWENIPVPMTIMIRDMDFISENEGWLVGNNGTIFHYQQGKIRQQMTPTAAHLWAVDMIRSDFGFAVGKNGAILKYNGRNWQPFPSPTIADLHDIEFIDEQHGWIVGAWGTLLYFDPQATGETQRQRYFLFRDQVHHQSENLMDRIDDVQGVTIADFNNDGLPDVYLTCYQNINHLLLNQGKGYYIDYVIESGAGGNVETRMGKSKYEVGTLAADFDRDGDVDLLLAGKQGTTRLLVNNGRAIFSDKTVHSQLPQEPDFVNGALADLNKDGYPDIILGEEHSGIRIFINRKYNRFRELLPDSLTLPKTLIRALAVADVNGDLHQDIIVIFHPATPALLLSDGRGHLQQDADYFRGEKIAAFVNSISVADFNNDGWNDLFMCSETGEDAIYIFDPVKKLFQNKSASWTVQQEGRSYSGVPGDFDIDGDVDLFVSRVGPDLLYLNENGTRFSEVAQEEIYSKAGHLSGYNTGAATADIDADGDLDLIVGNFEYWSSLLKNSTDDSNYICIKLNGSFDTAELLGGKIRMYSMTPESRLLAYREIIPGQGLFSQSSTIVHFGTGKHRRVRLNIQFPNGDERDYDNVSAGSTLYVNQSNKTVRVLLAAGRRFLQIVHIPQVPYEILKFTIFMILVFFSVRFIEKRYRWRPIFMVIYGAVLMSIYGVLTLFFFDPGSTLYHTLPFGMIFFTLSVLITINEQIRKSTLQQEQMQKILQQASVELSKINNIDKAINTVARTLKSVYPYRFLLIYLYYPGGNFFLCKKADGLRLNSAMRKIITEISFIRHLIRANPPLDSRRFSALLPRVEFGDGSWLVFPMVKKNDFQGFAVIGTEENKTDFEPQISKTIGYVLLQLTMTLSNIRIYADMQDQEKLAAIGSFASGIIHNLKNPIDGLRMIVEILHGEITADDARHEYIRELHQGVLRLKKMLIRTLDIRSYDDNTREHISLNKLLREVVDDFGRRNENLIQLKPGTNEIIIEGNKAQLKQAFENLIQNGIEASGYATPVVVQVDPRIADNTVRVDINDQGIGISDKELEKIFSIFHSTHEKGRGLGLPITQRIIKDHDGYISVYSEKRKGSTFCIILPISKHRTEDE